MELAADLLEDESNLAGGWAVEAGRPATLEEAADYLADLAERGLSATPSGGLTGIAAGAVPQGGAVVSTGLMKEIDYRGDGLLWAGAGVALEEISQYLSARRLNLFYPPDPTETTATVGGTLATDASGSDSFLYGSTRRWVESVEIVLPGGIPLNLHRGRLFFDGDGVCRVPGAGEVHIPQLRRLPLAKNAAGYWVRPGMDLVDLLIGSEGTLGLFTGALLRLKERPHALVDLAVFVRSMAEFWELLEASLDLRVRVRALEMMDAPCLELLRANPPKELPELPEGTRAVLLLRAEAGDEKELDLLLEELDHLLSEAGVPPKATWGGFEESEHRRILLLRHSLPETVNEQVAQAGRRVTGIHKLGSDAAVEVSRARELYERTREILNGMELPHLVFGHVGQGHLHANVIPSSRRELEEGERAMRLIASAAADMGGTVSAEHGLGRLKSDYLELMLSPEELAGMRAVRRSIDPRGLLCPAITWA